MSKMQLKAKLVKKEQLKDDIFKFSVEAQEIVNIAKPGQFLEIRVTDQVEPFLRRPISIYNLDKENGILEFIFQVKGKGTKILAQKQEGELIDIIGPLGNGTFEYSKYQNLAIIGGGIGIFPLYELAKEAKLDGKNGFAINFLKEDIENGKIDSIFACGPMPMLRAVKELAIEKNIPCQVSLEEKMGCGIGVCLGCAVKTAESSSDSPEYKHVCKAGPVFEAGEVEF